MTPARREEQVPGEAMRVRLTLHGQHAVLRKVSRALNVRIWPAQDALGPHVIVEEGTAAELAAIVQILSGQV